METDTNSLEGFCHAAAIAQLDSGFFPQSHTFSVSDQSARDLLTKSRFQLCNLFPSLFSFRLPQKERGKLAEARQELKALREKGEKGLTIQGLMVVQIQRPYLWCDPFIIQVPAPNPTANA